MDQNNPLDKIPSLRGIQKLTLKERLIKERELTELIINCLPGIFYLQDQAGKYLRWNRNFEKVSGYSGEEIVNMHPLDFFDPRDHEKMNEATRKVYKEGYNETEGEIITKTGKKFLYYLNGISVIYEGRLCLLGAGLDLTARELAEREIKDSNKKYRSLFEQASDPIFIADLQGNYTDVNRSFCKLFGYSKKELLSMNVRSLFCPVELKKYPLRFDLLMKGKHLFSDRIMIHNNGTILETEANVRKFGDDHIMGIVRDVTVVRRLQREIEQERMEQKVQEQKKITRAVIKAQERERNIIGRELHDHVNQLLTSTRICLSTAKSTATGKTDFLDKSIHLIDATINEIRILSRKHATPLRDFDLKEQIHSMVKIMEEGIGFKITVHYDVPGHTRLTDELKLNIYRVVQEHLQNMYQHASSLCADVKIFSSDEQVYVTIQDNGIGYELGIKKKGDGIVNIINRIESFNGLVSFENKPGTGSILNIRIPLTFQ